MEPTLLAAAEHPSGFRHIPDPPERLWLRGPLPAPDFKYLTVVGSRALTAYGRDAITKLIGGLAGYPVAIVSGLALGADAAAHEAALAAGLPTIAFPGSGLADRAIAPRTNLGLARRILNAGGALISEWEPSAKAAPWRFPARNRLMVGIADAVLMVEACEKSGTLITARLSGEYGRELLCVPHRIGDVHAEGGHQFLRLGATLVSTSAHILKALRIEADACATATAPRAFASDAERAIYEMLAEPHERDELLRKVGYVSGVALTALVSLELNGYIIEEFGKWRRKA
ncbi:MAG TPA: DNA-processing protein DprA [Candidatus Paceibacterota bacterium]|nr:DNA-processing protein DprA [Candidatus Paceibacterota bacterium]